MTYRTSKGSRILKVVSGSSASFLVIAGETSILVDTSHMLKRKALFRSLDLLDVGKIEYVIITHAHYDHTGNVLAIVERYRSHVITHRSNDGLLREAKNSPVRGTNLLFKAYVAALGWPFKMVMRYPPCEPDVLVDDELALSEHVRMIHTPGQTEGSVSVIVDNEIALVGDLMFGVLPRSVMPPFGESVVQLRKSWRKVLDTGCSLMLPAHGGPISADRLRRNMR